MNEIRRLIIYRKVKDLAFQCIIHGLEPNMEHFPDSEIDEARKLVPLAMREVSEILENYRTKKLDNDQAEIETRMDQERHIWGTGDEYETDEEYRKDYNKKLADKFWPQGHTQKVTGRKPI